MQSVLEKKRKKYRELYELLFTDYRMPTHRISVRLRWSRSAYRTLKESQEQQYLVGPQGRKRAYANTSEYVYFFNAEDRDIVYMKYCEDPRVVYNVDPYGFCTSLVISKEEIEVDGEIVLKGPRSDYYVPYTPDQSWEQAFDNMYNKVENFNSDNYIPQEFIKNHRQETIKWDEDDEMLYRYFKYDLRKQIGSLIKEQHISENIIYYWLETLEKRCSVLLGYYPESLLSYDTYLSIFETEYEDFIIEVFSELPASPTFFKVADKLIMFAYLPRGLMRNVTPKTASKSYYPLLEVELLNKEIIERKERALVGNFWREWL